MSHDRFSLASFFPRPNVYRGGCHIIRQNPIVKLLALVEPLRKSVRDYQSNLSKFFHQSKHVMVVSPILGRTDQEYEDVWRVAEQHNANRGFVRLSVINLYSALKILPIMQKLFREYFDNILDEVGLQALYSLEQKETAVLNSVGDLWLPFAMRPHLQFQNPKKKSHEWSIKRLREIKKHLKRSWKKRVNAEKCEKGFTVL